MAAQSETNEKEDPVTQITDSLNEAVVVLEGVDEREQTELGELDKIEQAGAPIQATSTQSNDQASQIPPLPEVEEEE